VTGNPHICSVGAPVIADKGTDQLPSFHRTIVPLEPFDPGV
jgi:hypothetical protein